MASVFTIGHSTHASAALIALLQTVGVTLLVDVRSIPRSGHNPQFNQDALASVLAKSGIAYRHMKSLGGMRKPVRDSVNQGWKSDGFRGYADYMQTTQFESALLELINLAGLQRVAIMCAEAVPSHCHRSLISDALAVRGIEVTHLLPHGNQEKHRLTPWVVAEGVRLSYPFSLV